MGIVLPLHWYLNERTSIENNVIYQRKTEIEDSCAREVDVLVNSMILK